MPGCGLIFGGDQRVDNRSHDYTVVRLDREKSGAWHIMTPGSNDTRDRHQNGSGSDSPDKGPTADDTGDVAFEHFDSGSIISVNSVCREYRDASLDELSKYLLLGLNTSGPVLTQDIEVDGTKALASTVDASMDQRSPSGQTSSMPVRVRAVVLRTNSCTYDLMFISRPDAFERLLPTFERFLKGFHAQ